MIRILVHDQICLIETLKGGYLYMVHPYKNETILCMQPTLHFFQNGKKTSEVIGADVQLLKETMEELYK